MGFRSGDAESPLNEARSMGTPKYSLCLCASVVKIFDANRLNFKGWQYANPANNVTYHYDVANRLTSVDDAGYTGTYSFIYDNMDRLSEADVAYSFLSGTYRVNYTYDAASNLKTMQDPQAGQNTYNYDVLNRLSQLISPAGTFGFGYDFDSRRTSLTRPNNITTTYTYDTCKKGQLRSILHKNGATTLDGATYSFTYNSVTDNINWKQKTDDRISVVTGYTYDKIYQLLTAVQGSTTESYTYDKVGNRLTALSPTGNWAYDNANQLNSRPNVSYTYDSNGNTQNKTDSNGQTTYSWDF